MLDTLRRIIQEVNTAPDLDQALDIIVRRVRESVGVDVASVYLKDIDTGQYVLSATEGLRKSAIGHVRFNPGEGLVGMVGEREEPVNIEDAPSHPRYCLPARPAKIPIMPSSVCRLSSTVPCWGCWSPGNESIACLQRMKRPSW